MTGPLRLVLIALSTLAALLVAAAILAWVLVDAEKLMEEMEGRLGDVLGMTVKIGQPAGFRLLPGASVTLTDLEVSRQGDVIARAESARVRIALPSLLTGNVRPLALHLQRPELRIERSSQGELNIYQSGEDAEGLNDLTLRRLRVSDARVTYLDQASGREWQFEHCELDLRNIRRSGGGLDAERTTLTTTGELKCSRLGQAQFSMSDVSVALGAHNGQFDVRLVSADAFEGKASGRLQADFSDSPPNFKLTSTLSGFDIGAFMTLLEPEHTATGRMQLEVVLNAEGRTWQEVKNSAAGSLSMTAGELVLDGYDLDDELDGYAATQRFNLIDVGAVFLAGPLGLATSRGYAFSGLLEGSGGSTRIVELVSEWTVDGGVAQAQDVAFRTLQNRLALAGGLDFTEYRFDDLRVAVVDRDGCALVEQALTGPFREPEVEQPNFLVTAVGPFLDLIERGMRAITNEDCEAFYTGSISHP